MTSDKNNNVRRNNKNRGRVALIKKCIIAGVLILIGGSVLLNIILFFKVLSLEKHIDDMYSNVSYNIQEVGGTINELF